MLSHDISQFTRRHMQVFSACLVSASNGGRSTSSGFPNSPLPQLTASHSKSSKHLYMQISSPLIASSLTYQTTHLHPYWSIAVQKYRLFVAVPILLRKHALSSKPFLSNDRCTNIVAYFSVTL